MLRTILILCGISTSLCSCTATAPKNDLGYASFDSLSSLNGCYENGSESQSGPYRHLLSTQIWRGVNFGNNGVDAVRVEVIGNDILQVAAIKAHRVVREDKFVKGKDFTFDAGLITIVGSSGAFGSNATQPGNVFLGGGAHATTLGLDAAGNGRAESSVVFAGTVFLVIPVAGKVKEVDRFKRNSDLCTVQ